MSKQPFLSPPRLVLGFHPTHLNKHCVLTGATLAQHKHISGLTGMGKSFFLACLCVQLLKQGIPFALLDPHSDLCELVLRLLLATGYFADNRAYEHLWYVPFNRDDAHIAFNYLKQPYPPHVVASTLLEAWRRAWSNLEGGTAVNLENILLACVYVLTVNKRPLTDLSRLVSDAQFREKLLTAVDDPHILDFFASRFATWSSGKIASLTESTLRRAFLLSFSPPLRYALGQRENKLDFRAIMDNRRSVLFDLGALDSQTQRFLGGLIATGFETAALSRADLPIEKRSPYHLVLDEYSQYSAQSGAAMERILTLTRKFGLSLTLACQTLSQTKAIADALQNTLHVTFQMGYADAYQLAPQFMQAEKEQETAPSFWQALFAEDDTPEMLPASSRTEWAEVIANLNKRECLVHLQGSTVKIKTLGIDTNGVASTDVARVKEVYVQRLLTSRDQCLDRLEEPSARPLSPRSALPHPHVEIAEVPAARQRRGVPIDDDL